MRPGTSTEALPPSTTLLSESTAHRVRGRRTVVETADRPCGNPNWVDVGLNRPQQRVMARTILLRSTASMSPLRLRTCMPVFDRSSPHSCLPAFYCRVGFVSFASWPFTSVLVSNRIFQSPPKPKSQFTNLVRHPRPDIKTTHLSTSQSRHPKLRIQNIGYTRG